MQVGVHSRLCFANVAIDEGVFGQGLPRNDKEQIIIRQCLELSGYTFHNYPQRVRVDCLGPLATNTSCCYCYFSRHYEELNSTGSFKYWSCAVERNHSLAPLNASRIEATKRKRVALVTGRFGYGDYFKPEVDAYCDKIRAMNVIEPTCMHCFWDSPDFVLQNRNFSRHLRYRSDPNDVSAKGGGFWFHKTVLLQHYLNVYSDGDYLVYTDIDRIDYFRTGTFHATVETLARRGDDLVVEVIGNAAEASFTKEDMLVAFDASESMRSSSQPLANMIVMRNSPTMKRFVDAWVDCSSDWHMVSDEPSLLPERKDFSAHRHDQSIFSLLLKRHMKVQEVVGPPARPYQYISQISTYKFRDGADPSCPFTSFYSKLAAAGRNQAS